MHIEIKKEGESWKVYVNGEYKGEFKGADLKFYHEV